jgi:ribokinase
MSDSRKPIVVVGSIMMDLVTRTPRIPAIGQTLIGTAFETNQGGKGANQAVAAARLGYPAAMVATTRMDPRSSRACNARASTHARWRRSPAPRVSRPCSSPTTA